ncbi:trace amine-associated receptor 4-like, partial [Anabas testudineus]|uniref:trace amine-associated receptor 4-like n=1 Tax=Anabas testudineus TaxID=64144 RepID=UPI00143D30E7
FPQLLNSSCMKPKRPHFQTLLSYILLLSISVLTTFLNLLVIISISHFKQLHTPTNLLLLSLAVSDFLLGPLLLFQIMFIDGCWLLGDLMCSLVHFVAYFLSFASVGTMVLISIDRYVAICVPLHYFTQITQNKVKIYVCLCWIFSIIFQGVMVMDNLQQPGRFKSCVGQCVIVNRYIFGLTVVVLTFIAPITVILVLYMRVFVVAVTQARAMRSHIAAVSLQRSVKVTAKNSELKAARTLGVVIVVFLLCLCPYYCVTLTGQDNAINSSSALYTFVTNLYSFHSCLNPMIYAFFYPWFRKSVNYIVTLKILQPDSCETNMS